MVVDTSVILAIVLDEAEGPFFVERILRSDRAAISAGSIVELSAVSRRAGSAARSIDGSMRFFLTFHYRSRRLPLPKRLSGVMPIAASVLAPAIPRSSTSAIASPMPAKESGEPLLFKGERLYPHRHHARSISSCYVPDMAELPALPPRPLRWLFLDLNSYFASVEQQVQPALRGRPVIVAPVGSDTTVAIAASVEAKRFGIRRGTPVWEAKAAVPRPRRHPGPARALRALPRRHRS
ncbi:hypothetical protein AB5I41_28605 [Sphingomonas sp. MMS24-JH45]